MNLDTIIDKLIKAREKLGGDTDVLVDTEGATYRVHMVKTTDISAMTEEESGVRKIVSISLDDNVKEYY